MGNVIAAAVAFVGTHFLLSHPLRRAIVGRIGEGPFAGLYSLVAAVTLGWLAFAYRAAPATPLLWAPGDGIWIAVTIVMLLASVLLVGSLIGNPALPDPSGQRKPVPEARGVFAITRHPMMWAFALWGACHIAVYPMAANIVLASSVIILALVGAAFQDDKKRQLRPNFWPAWQQRTSYMPFAAILAGRARFGGFRAHDLVGGLVVWLAATWAHMPLAGWAAGIWRWL
jgi:uncharacterized membrane protein